MEQYVKGFKGFTPVKMCGLSPLASFYVIGAILVLTSDLCRLSLPVSVRKLVLTLSLSVNYLHELIYINPII